MMKMGIGRRSGIVVLACAAVLAAVLALPASSNAQERPLKIGLVNLDRVVAESPAGRDLQQKLEAFQQRARGEIEAKQAEANGIRQQAVDGGNTLSEERLAELQKQYQDKLIEIQRITDDKQREGQKMQGEGLEEVEKQLAPIFEALRDDEGYDLILNTVPGVVLISNARADITQKVLDRLKAATGE